MSLKALKSGYYIRIIIVYTLYIIQKKMFGKIYFILYLYMLYFIKTQNGEFDDRHDIFKTTIKVQILLRILGMRQTNIRLRGSSTSI